MHVNSGANSVTAGGLRTLPIQQKQGLKVKNRLFKGQNDDNGKADEGGLNAKKNSAT